MKIVLMSGLLCLSTACGASIPDSKTVDAAYLAAQHIPSAGTLIGARHVSDQSGEHVLVLNRRAGPSPNAPNSGRIEHIELNADYYSRQSNGWRQDWTVRDFVDCPGLDAAADFFVASVAVTDVNGDGKAEVTLPYKLFCGGGVDSSSIKVILREGRLKLAIRGESEVRLPGQQTIGGDHQYDKALLTAPYGAYKKHMDQIWKAVSLDVRRETPSEAL